MLGGVAGLRWALGVLLVVAAVLALGAYGEGKQQAPAAPATPMRVGALLFTVPRGFSRHDTQRHDRLVGVLITNYSVKAHSSTLTTGVFPANRVALVLGRWEGRRVGAPPLRLPLSLDELRAQHHPDGTAWNAVLRFHGSLYTSSFWVGRIAPPHDRAALLHALMSIHRAL
jgi:hypothetical protein